MTTLEDPEGRPTVRDLVLDAGERLYPIGRLDVNTTGLLLLTNDGALAARLAHPRREVGRVYQAKVRGTPPDEVIVRLRRGVKLEDGKSAPATVRIVEKLPTKTWLEVTVREGRSRLVRRMCEAVGHPVEKLARVGFGPLVLGELPMGRWRELSPGELRALRRAAGLKPAAGVAGAAGPPRRASGTPPRTRTPRPASRARGGPRGAPSAPREDGAPRGRRDRKRRRP